MRLPLAELGGAELEPLLGDGRRRIEGGEVVLPADGPAFHVWRVHDEREEDDVAEVQLKDVDKVYDNGVHAVKDLSLEIEDGEFLVLVGPSGCGKTTALRMVAGLEEISDGTVSIGGRVVNDLSPKDRDIAMVFQNYALYPHLSRRRQHRLRAAAAQDAEGTRSRSASPGPRSCST